MEVLRGMYSKDLKIPLVEPLAHARASAPLKDWADWPQSRKNIAAAHG
jgi:hypothetical protein